MRSTAVSRKRDCSGWVLILVPAAFLRPASSHQRGAVSFLIPLPCFHEKGVLVFCCRGGHFPRYILRAGHLSGPCELDLRTLLTPIEPGLGRQGDRVWMAHSISGLAKVRELLPDLSQTSQIILVTPEWGSQSNLPLIHTPSRLQVDF